MRKKYHYCLGIACALILPSCTGTLPGKGGDPPVEQHSTRGVSVWDRIAARSEPLRNAPRVSLLSLGESFLYLDTFAIDSSSDNTKFLKARLSDSSVVWVYDFASVLNAKPAVITSEVPLYLRPDLLTITDTRMHSMEIVAVVEEWDDWIKVVSEKKEQTGWIKKEFLTTNTIDLAFSLLVKRSLEEQDPEKRISQLEELLDTNPYPNTVFLPELINRVDMEKELMSESEHEREWDRWNDRNR